MKINKIKLKNYRNHKDTTIEFESGINLLLGKNGAGKSSIFEALGIALFDVEPRDNNLKNAVTKEEKTATITVEFTGNDFVDYIVERKIGSQSRHILKELNGTVISERKTNVLEKIGELAGINGKNTKDIFKNVISAYQNDLVNIFNLTPSLRNELFNKIFDTEIYKKIYDSLLNVENEYNKRILADNEKINLLSEQLKNYINLEENIDYFKNEISYMEKEKSSLESKKEKIENERKIVQKNIEELKIIKSELKTENEKLEILTKNKEKLEKEILESQSAKEILMKSEKGYNEYIKREFELNELYLTERNLRLKEKQLKKIQDDISSNINKQKVLEVEIKNISEKIEEMGKTLNELKEENLQLNDILDKKNIELSKVLSKEKEIINEINKFEKDYEIYRDIKRTLMDIENQLIEEKNLKKIIEDNNIDLENVQKSLEEINEKIYEKKELESKLSELNINLENLKKSKEQLQDGMCPILNEKCMNLEEKGGSTNYFDLNILKIQKDIDKINNKIISLGDLDKIKVKLEKEINEKKVKIETAKNKLTEIEKKKIMKEELLLRKNAIEKIYNNLSEKKDELDIDKNKIISLKSTIENEIKNIKNQIKKNKENISNIEKIINENTKLKELNLSKKESINKELENLYLKEKEFSNVLSEIDNIEKIISEKEKIKNSLKKEYEKYIKNKEIAGKLEKLQLELEKIEKEILTIQNNIIYLNEKLKNYEDIEILSIKLKNIEGEINNIYNEINKNSSKLSELKNELKNLKIQLNEKKEKEKQKNKLELNLKILEKKLKLVKDFRENIKSMGTNVSSNFTEIISSIATENYRKMTGKNETIKWESKNNYRVILKDSIKGEREFSILSGGEQVSVAISLRTALARFLSKANFYILDEPTVNLDDERKNMLAENLKNMLDEIGQAFIVTHDGTFSEMAENVIEL
ncbi:AAA family ATPase [Marinitoga aeolica]|uniref:AAA family ATPase n=1 Tax=Marinitoga aeolica TaxID=2809031 RepID=A0ABY8PQS0_9BACT|nr:AAA family ATPase [Marinitoga aeolica]WGS64966.1 AAA family ATPase [Marinitoga aeolica]